MTATSADQSTAKVTKPATKSVLNESKQIERAAMLIGMGARMQVLESETTLSYERLIRLYKEVAGKSPSKGQLPFSTDWFLNWQENIHSSLFLNIYEYLSKGVDLDSVELARHCGACGHPTSHHRQAQCHRQRDLQGPRLPHQMGSQWHASGGGQRRRRWRADQGRRAAPGQAGARCGRDGGLSTARRGH